MARFINELTNKIIAYVLIVTVVVATMCIGNVMTVVCR